VFVRPVAAGAISLVEAARELSTSAWIHVDREAKTHSGRSPVGKMGSDGRDVVDVRRQVRGSTAMDAVLPQTDAVQCQSWDDKR
jgi:hypothetical protein